MRKAREDVSLKAVSDLTDESGMTEVVEDFWSDSERIADIHRMIRDIHSCVMPLVPSLVEAKRELDERGLAGLMRAIVMPNAR